jgi:putative PIN family toxin of toxin-antitoxin system
VFRITADTNIYISALNFGGKPLQVLELARSGQIELAISNAIITEMSRILFNKFFWNRQDVGEAMNQILEFTKYVHPDHRLDVVPSDPDDNRVLECALKANSDTIVTGDTDLLVMGTYGRIKIQSAADFLESQRQR